MKKGKQHDSSISLSTQQAEAEFNFGVFYRTVEEHIERFANEARGAFTLACTGVIRGFRTIARNAGRPRGS